jgi:hypothetical protein
MIAIGMLVMVVATLWLVVAAIGFVFKLAFAIIGGVFSVIGALLGLVIGAVVLLCIAPLIILAMLPALLPLLFVVGAVWLIVHATRSTRATPTQSTPAH